jgi:hypothetical protein
VLADARAGVSTLVEKFTPYREEEEEYILFKILSGACGLVWM